MTKKLLDGDLDLAISNIHTSSPDIEYVPFYEEHTILIVSKAMLKQLSVDANLLQEQLLSGHLGLLKDCPFIISESSGTAAQTSAKLFQTSGFYPKVPVQATYINTMPELLQLPEEYLYPIYFSFLKRTYHWNMISEFIQAGKELYGNT